MNIEEAIDRIKRIIKITYTKEFATFELMYQDTDAIETLLIAYEEKSKELEKEKGKNKNAIDFINERKKTVNKDMAEGTRLQVGTFMWQVDELLEILKGVEEE